MVFNVLLIGNNEAQSSGDQRTNAMQSLVHRLRLTKDAIALVKEKEFTLTILSRVNNDRFTANADRSCDPRKGVRVKGVFTAILSMVLFLAGIHESSLRKNQESMSRES